MKLDHSPGDILSKDGLLTVACSNRHEHHYDGEHTETVYVAARRGYPQLYESFCKRHEVPRSFVILSAE